MEKHENPLEYIESIEKIKPAGIIAGTPGIGKSTLTETLGATIKIADMDPIEYRDHPRWPQNYIDDIIMQNQTHDLLLISAHPEVTQALREQGLAVTLVCPDESLREEYKKRFEARGHSPDKVDMLLKYGFRTNEENQRNFAGGKIIFLQTGQFLSDIIE